MRWKPLEMPKTIGDDWGPARVNAFSRNCRYHSWYMRTVLVGSMNGPRQASGLTPNTGLQIRIHVSDINSNSRGRAGRIIMCPVVYVFFMVIELTAYNNPIPQISMTNNRYRDMDDGLIK